MTRTFYPGDLADALQSCKLDRAREYIRNGADPDDANDKGCTALMWAIKAKSPEIVRLLLEAGADVNKTCKRGSTALMWAAAEADPAVVQLLIDKGASIDAKNNAGETAVGWAVEWINNYGRAPEALNVLILNGASFREDLDRAEEARERDITVDIEGDHADEELEEALRTHDKAVNAAQVLKEAWRKALDHRHHEIAVNRQEYLRKHPVKVNLRTGP